MTEENQVEQPSGLPPRRYRRRMWLAGASAITFVALAFVWQARAPIADRFIQDSLKDMGVPARYQITRIGPRTQRLENVVLGDPARPDLTAKVIEIDLGIAGFSPVVKAVRADGVTVRANWRNGRLSLGSLGKLRGEGRSDGALPDIDLSLREGLLLLATDYGDVKARIEGHGKLASGFQASTTIVSGPLSWKDCATPSAAARLALTTIENRIRATGPIMLPVISCTNQNLHVARPEAQVEAEFDPRTGPFQLRAQLGADEAQAAKMVLTRPMATIMVQGGSAEPLSGKLELTAPSFKGQGLRTDSMRLSAQTGDGKRIVFTTQLKQVDLSRASDSLGVGNGLADTPLAPLARRFAGAMQRLSRANEATVQGEWSDSQLLIRRAVLQGTSGGLVALDGGGQIRLGGREGWALDGAIITSGDGLPNARLRANRRTDGGLSARLAVEQYQANDARLKTTPILLERSPAGAVTIRSSVTLDGPLADGFVRGLTLPVDLNYTARGEIRLRQRCLPVAWQALRIGSLAIDPARMTICNALTTPSTGSIMLMGTLGKSPISLALSKAQHDLAQGRIVLTGVEAQIGADLNPVRLSAGMLEGKLGQAGMSGQFNAGTARIGTVPLDLSGLEGHWRWADGQLVVDGQLRVADTEKNSRFNPLLVPDARFELANGQIVVTGSLVHAQGAAPVASVKIRHNLAAGDGVADLAVNSLRFGQSLQPDDLTPLALGIVANVDGTVTGEGAIRWNQSGVTSTGTFETSGMNLAAAFGPVTNLSTRISFSDLLGLVTEPGQEITLGSVNPGIDVRGGVVRYALLPGKQARIESGRWPFAGGILELLPTTLDLDARKARRMAFRVTGLDAGAFINELALDDISATGTYDGLLPMVFDEQGGRIEGGILVARQKGLPPLVVQDVATLTVPCDPSREAGNLSYVGQVSNAQLGTMGRLAFDALKNLRYKCLTILLDGALDGEFVTRVAINGVNQGSPEAGKSIMTRAFLGLPFIFNVRIEAPFRGLINTARSFSDPSQLIRDCLKPQFNAALASGSCNGGVAVQPRESEEGIGKDRK
jgi:translocation and assembly module TamB